MQCFPRKFALTSVMKINCKMRKLCMHPEYIPSTSKQGKFLPQTNIFLGITTLFVTSPQLCGSRLLRKKNICFSSFRSRYHRLANRKKLILPLEKYFKTLKNMIIGTSCTQLFESFTTFHSGRNNGVEILDFDATCQEHFQIKLRLVLILQIKQQFSVMFQL